MARTKKNGGKQRDKEPLVLPRPRDEEYTDRAQQAGDVLYKSDTIKARPKEQMDTLVLPTAEDPPLGRMFAEGGRDVWHGGGEAVIRKYPLTSRRMSEDAFRRMMPEEELVQHTPGIYHLPKASEERREDVENRNATRAILTIEGMAALGASDWDLQQKIYEVWSKGYISAEMTELLRAKYGRNDKGYLRKGNTKGKWDWEQWGKKPGSAGNR